MTTLIEIFRAGRHTAMNGEALSFSEKDLRDIVAGYDPAVHEAPIVIGHPADNAPAFGWVRGLAQKGDVISAKASQVDPAFAEAVRSGRFKKRSAAFYLPDSPNNPTPGKYYLRHVGFLGAMPPAVKGLRDVSFAGSPKESITIEFADEEEESEIEAIADAVESGDLRSRLKAWLIKMFGQEAADEAMPPELMSGGGGDTADFAEAADVLSAIERVEGLTVEQLEALRKAVEEVFAAEAAQDEGGEAASTSTSTDFAEPVSRAIRAKARALSKRERDVADRERSLRRTEHVAFLERLVADGRPLPCKPATLVSIMTILDESKSAEFAEGPSALEVFKRDVLARLPRQVNFGEFGSGDGSVEHPRALAQRAIEYQAEQAAKGNVISTSDAVSAVQKQGR